jgi:hypothetical protein
MVQEPPWSTSAVTRAGGTAARLFRLIALPIPLSCSDVVQPQHPQQLRGCHPIAPANPKHPHRQPIPTGQLQDRRALPAEHPSNHRPHGHRGLHPRIRNPRRPQPPSPQAHHTPTRWTCHRPPGSASLIGDPQANGSTARAIVNTWHDATQIHFLCTDNPRRSTHRRPESTYQRLTGLTHRFQSAFQQVWRKKGIGGACSNRTANMCSKQPPATLHPDGRVTRHTTLSQSPSTPPTAILIIYSADASRLRWPCTARRYNQHPCRPPRASPSAWPPSNAGPC